MPQWEHLAYMLLEAGGGGGMGHGTNGPAQAQVHCFLLHNGQLHNANGNRPGQHAEACLPPFSWYRVTE